MQDKTYVITEIVGVSDNSISECEAGCKNSLHESFRYPI